MSRPVLAGLAGIAALLVGGLLVVTRMERSAAPASAAPAVEGPAPVLAPVQAPAPEPASQPAPAVPPAPAAGAPPAVDFAELQRRLEPMRREVFAGLASLSGRVESCHLAREEFVLVLEALDGRVRIVEARFPELDPGMLPEGVAPPPPESPGAKACVKGTLEGVILSSPSAIPGRRWEMPWPGRTAP